MNDIFGPAGTLAQHLEGYEPRPGQLEMAEAVAELLDSKNEESSGENELCPCLVIEAETGLGKTLAYLAPAVLSGRKTVVSTNTRNLQDQILLREIPFIQQYIAKDFKALCVKGRQNYLCLYRYNQLRAGRQSQLFIDSDAEKLEEWLKDTTHAERSELKWLSTGAPLWQKICCLSHFCMGNDCPHQSECFLNRLRKDAAAAKLLIVNHHLLFSDLAVRRTGYGEVLPRYETVIFDEAHHVENVASTFFGSTFSKYQVLDLVGDVRRSVEAELPGGPSHAAYQAADTLAGRMELFITFFPTEKGRFPLHELLRNQPQLAQTRDNLLSALDHLVGEMKHITHQGPWEQYKNRSHDLMSRLELITTEWFDDAEPEANRFTYWYERTDRNLSLFATPVDVSKELQETLFTSTTNCVFTSATLTTSGKFTFFLKRLGLPEYTPSLSFSSPFDYKQQTLLYIPESTFPEPTGSGYQQVLHARIEELINHAGGRALVLFTSFQAMDKAFYALRDQLDYPLLRQGDAPRSQLLTQFAQQTNSVLFAVSSFWEGVDVPGDSLSLVIIDKLPFEVPSDPVIMARINNIKASGGNPFFDFQVPKAILNLRQGVGRLMRSSKDRGVIAILDIRLYTKGYGRRFLNSLPPSPVRRKVEEVALFFKHHDSTN